MSGKRGAPSHRTGSRERTHAATRRAFLASMGAAFVARRARAASLPAFGGEIVGAILDEKPATLARGNPRTFDPHLARTRLEREIASALHVPLFWKEPRRTPGPLVEAASASRDERTWTISLSRAAFSDGSPLTAQEAARSLLRAIQSPAGRALALLIADARAKGDRVLEIETRVPLPSLPAVLSSPSSAILKIDAADPLWGPIGAGAFVPAGENVLAANPRAAAGRAFADKLVLASVREASDAAFRRGSVHVAPIDGKPGVDADVPATIALLISPRLAPELRARIAACPDRVAISEVSLRGRGRPAGTLLPPALLGPLEGRAPKAEKKSAARISLSTMLVADASAEIRAVAERIAVELDRIGIGASPGYRTPDALESDIEKQRWDLALVEWAPSVLDAGYAAGSLAKEPAFASSLPADAGLDALPSIENADARTAAARTADEKIRAAGLVVPIVHLRRELRRTDRVEGLRLDAMGLVDWGDVSLRRTS